LAAQSGAALGKIGAAARYIDAKTELLRLRVAEKCRDLIPRSEVDETLHVIAGIVTRHLGGMAARCSPDLRVRATIDRIVFEVRTEMAIAATKLADARGEPPLDSPSEDWRCDCRAPAPLGS
jgi:hypothetical protein